MVGVMTPQESTHTAAGDPVIFDATRPTNWPAPEGTEATVTARRALDGTVGITWKRSDNDRTSTVALTPDEFDGIARALGYRKEARVS